VSRLNVGIFIFDDVEVLDFAGPYEVFSRTRTEPGVESRQTDASAPFRVFTVSPAKTPVRAIGGLTVVPDYGFEDAPAIDLIVIPGGFGTRALLQDEAALAWVRGVAATAKTVTSVCTGALLLARVGLLENRRATTHWCALEWLKGMGDIEVVSDVRYVDDGVVTSAGVSAGIDMAFHVVESLCGKAVADETSRYIDFPRAARGTFRPGL